MKIHSVVKITFSVFTLLATLILANAQKPILYTISGDVKDNAGQKIVGARVCALIENILPGEKIPCVKSGADGDFAIQTDKPGKYLIIAGQTEAGYQLPFFLFFRNPSFPPPEMILADDSPNHRVSVVLGAKNGTLIGKNIDAATDLPVENARILMCHAADAQICHAVSAKNADGKFQTSLPMVPFTLKIKADGFEDWIGINGIDAPNSPITVEPGEKLEITAYLRRKPYAVNFAIGEVGKQVGVNLPAPIQISPDDNQVFNHFPRKTTLEWRAVEGAVSYEVEVDYCLPARQNARECVNPQPNSVTPDPPRSNIKTTSYEFSFVGAQPGRWRVWAIDKQGREGFKSSWRRFVYTH